MPRGRRAATRVARPWVERQRSIYALVVVAADAERAPRGYTSRFFRQPAWLTTRARARCQPSPRVTAAQGVNSCSHDTAAACEFPSACAVAPLARTATAMWLERVKLSDRDADAMDFSVIFPG